MQACSSTNNSAAGSRRLVVLFVEGDMSLRQSMARLLREAGYKVEEAANTAEALVVLQSTAAIDLLLTETEGPDHIEGAALAQEAKAARPDLRIVVTSTKAPEWPLRRLIDIFVGKPYDNTRVMQRIGDLLSHPAD